MNAKQSLKKATKTIDELVNYQFRATRDITAYNECILSMIQGGSACKWCNVLPECERDEKGGLGCEEWLLSFDEKVLKQKKEDLPIKIEGSGGDADESSGILPASSES